MSLERCLCPPTLLLILGLQFSLKKEEGESFYIYAPFIGAVGNIGHLWKYISKTPGFTDYLDLEMDVIFRDRWCYQSPLEMVSIISLWKLSIFGGGLFVSCCQCHY